MVQTVKLNDTKEVYVGSGIPNPRRSPGICPRDACFESWQDMADVPMALSFPVDKWYGDISVSRGGRYEADYLQG
jgi:hypothetical protein